jgi:hypothetical protein
LVGFDHASEVASMVDAQFAARAIAAPVVAQKLAGSEAKWTELN